MARSTVNVAVRIRPFIPQEQEKGSKTCVAVVQGKQKIQVANAGKSYRFDHVFGPEADNDRIYNSAIRNGLAEVFNERDVTILAYGQRNSGKTYTMGTNYTGNENMGIIPRAIATLYDVIDSDSDHMYQITVTFVELYNKKLYDLLAPNKEGDERIVKITNNGSKVFGLTEKQVTNAKEALQYLIQGSRERVTSDKRANSQSSRSHVIFTISIHQGKNVDSKNATTSKVHLVDLAGTTRGKKAGKKTKRDINKDFLVLGNLINNIRKGKHESCTRYQDNKLAILLQESLQGNSMTLIIACVSPADCYVVETLDTLRYANRLRKMRSETISKETDRDTKEIAREVLDRNLITATLNQVNDHEVQRSTLRRHDTQESRESSKTEREKFLSEENEKMEVEMLQDAQESSEYSKTEREKFQSETDDNKETERIQDTQESSKYSNTEQEKFRSETIEALPSNLFSKIADLFLEPFTTEQKELQEEIYELRKKLRDRTEKLNANLMDVVCMQKREVLAEKRRESTKFVVTKILEEFQKVLSNIAENSNIRDWIECVCRRIDDLLNEHKKVAEKMLKCEIFEDDAVDDENVEHTMHQAGRYHELQGVNRCIALLEELMASLVKESAPIGELVRDLEDTKNKIKALEIEKVDLIQLLKNAESTNEIRESAEFGIEKFQKLDEKISELWGKRIKQMMAIERKEKFDQQIANVSTQIETLKSARVRLFGEMKDARKQWKRTSISGEQEKKSQNTAGTKYAKENSPRKSFRGDIKCVCKVSECLNRRCSCLKNGVFCINCDCNAELCRNLDKENNMSNIFAESQAFPTILANDDLKCACKMMKCLTQKCTCRKNGAICNNNCKCKSDFCKNKDKENVPIGSTDGKMEIDCAAKGLSIDLCMCREKGVTCTNCNRYPELREYKTKEKARRRLFADIEFLHENEKKEESRKRPRPQT